MKQLALPLLLICLLLGLSTASTNAASTITAGLTISPAVEQLNLTSGQKSVSFTSQVTNNTPDQVVINISTTDFSALNEVGGIVFLPNVTDRPHGLAQWLTPQVTQLVLPAGTSQAVAVSVKPDAHLAPGGHYGALIYRVIAARTTNKGDQVRSNGEVSSLVFLTTASGGTQSVKLDSLPLSHVKLSIPTSLNVVLTNTGNTQVAPSGIVTVVSSANKEIARGLINLDSGLVLPGTSRLYTVILKREVRKAFPGTYHVVVAYQASPTATIQSSTKSFLLINSVILDTGLAIVGVVIAGLIWRVTAHKPYRFRKP